MTQPNSIRWGLLGTGFISGKFAIGLQSADNGELVAVGSRSQANADRFAAEHGAPKAYDSYEGLVNDPDIDAVYIGTPHPFHKENTLLALTAGKHVLCEKPFAINAKEAAEMIDAARSSGKALMEAMWSRFLPTLVKTRQLIADGAIGEIRMVKADFGFRTALNPAGRLFNPELGGGALLDVGIYPLSLISMLLGKPAEMVSFANLGSTGIDEETAFMFRYPQGQIAIGSTAVRLNTPHVAHIMGTEGMIEIHAPWWASTEITLKNNAGEEHMSLPFKGNGYTHQAEALGQIIQNGEQDSSVMPLAETLTIMETMDQLRSQWGLVYPME